MKKVPPGQYRDRRHCSVHEGCYSAVHGTGMGSQLAGAWRQPHVVAQASISNAGRFMGAPVSHPVQHCPHGASYGDGIVW